MLLVSKKKKKKGVFHSKCDEKVSKQGDVYTSMTTFLSIKLRDPWIGVCMSLFLLFYDSSTKCNNIYA